MCLRRVPVRLLPRQPNLCIYLRRTNHCAYQAQREPRAGLQNNTYADCRVGDFPLADFIRRVTHVSIMPNSWTQRGSAMFRPGNLPLAPPVAFYTALLYHVFPIAATPIPTQLTSNATSSEQNTYSARGSGFQVLADGTQDLAALVGLFATDGVERYTIDYTRGFLPPVTAPLSLLGLLGYVRGLLKASLGIEFCERAGFSTASLRSHAGVRRQDVGRSERIVNVYYLERTISESSVQWKVVKTVPHTHESMPLIAGGGKRALRDRRAYNPSFSIAMCSLVRSGSTAKITFGTCVLCLALTSSISSLVTLLLAGPWIWTRYFACAGLPLSILVGGLPWCWEYIIEHLPFESCDWFRSDWKEGTASVARSTDLPGESLMRKNHFAYFARDDHFYIFDCRAVSVLGLGFIRVTSLCAAICITVAYICQYIELRSASATQSGIWLGAQGLLAIARVLTWHWAPKALGFSTEADIRWTDQRDKMFKNSLTELEITLCWSSVPNTIPNATWETDPGPKAEGKDSTQAPPLPKWLVGKIDSLRLVEAFGLWNRIRSEMAVESGFCQLRNASTQWDMPDYIFARWLQLRCRAYGHNITYTASKRRLGVGAWVCRIMQDMDGNLHIVPGVSLHVYSEDCKTNPSNEIIFFSHFRDPELNILSFPRNHADGTQTLYQGVAGLPNDNRGMPWLANRALEPFYQQIVDELWSEMLSALQVLGFCQV